MNIFKKYSKLIDDSIKNSQYKQEKDNIEFKPVILSILPFLFINYFIFYFLFDYQKHIFILLLSIVSGRIYFNYKLKKNKFFWSNKFIRWMSYTVIFFLFFIILSGIIDEIFK